MLLQVLWLQKDFSPPTMSLLKVGMLRHLHRFPLDSWAFVPFAGCCGNPQFPLWPGLAVRLLRSIVEQFSSNHLLFACSCCLSEVGIPFQWHCPSRKRSHRLQPYQARQLQVVATLAACAAILWHTVELMVLDVLSSHLSCTCSGGSYSGTTGVKP